MIGIIVDNDEAKVAHKENLINQGYSASDVDDLYVKGRDEVLLLNKGLLHVKETLYLDFLPQIGCELSKMELKVADYIRLRHLGSISVINTSNDSIMTQLFS